tara:strand:+ start:8972 stop:9232 length:261 start_codon:yes stop_codon:yes gene_type:complete
MLILSNQDKILKPICIYPNPTKEIINISNSSNVPIDKIVITDLTGKIIMGEKSVPNEINVSHLQHGLYVLRIQSNKKTHVSKFIKN